MSGFSNRFQKIKQLKFVIWITISNIVVPALQLLTITDDTRVCGHDQTS